MKINLPQKTVGVAHRYLGIFSIVIIFLLPSYVVRFRVGWIAFNLAELFIAFFLLIWMWLKAREKKLALSICGNPLLRESKYLAAIMLLGAGFLFSIVAGGAYYQGLGILKSWFLFPIIFAIVLYDLAKYDKKLSIKFFRAVFYSGAALSLLGFAYWFLLNLTYDGRLRLFFDSPNQFAMTLAPALIVGIFFLKEKISGGTIAGKAIIDFIFILLIAANLYFTRSAGAIFAVAISLLLAAIWAHRSELKLQQLAMIFLAIAIIFGGWVFLHNNAEGKLFGDRSSLASRIMIWKSAALIAKDNAVLGIGPGNFQSKYLEYQKYFPPYLEWAVPEPHNIFLAFWLQAGILGLAGFLLLLYHFFRDNKKAIYNNRLVGFICLALVLYFLLHGLVDTTYWKNDSAVVFWLVVIVNILLLKTTLEENPE